MATCGRKYVAMTLVFALTMALFGCGGTQIPETAPSTQPTVPTDATLPLMDFTVDADKVAKGDVNSGACVHDPSVLRVGDTKQGHR